MLELDGSTVGGDTLVSEADILDGKLVLTPAANAYGLGYATLTFRVQDNGGTDNGGIDLDPTANTITIDVSPVNDAPNAVADSTSVDEDASVTLDVRTNDNAGPNELARPSAVSIFSAPAHGTAEMVGSSIKYTPAAGYHGSDEFFYTLCDNGTLPICVDSGKVTVTVNSVNDAPSGTDKTITILEDGSHTFAAADFGFSDGTDSNTLLNVKITSLPASGSLTLLGNPVSAGMLISAGSLGNLVFTPATNANGNGYASFQFAVQDSGGTDNGGVDLDPSANTITIDVTAVNDLRRSRPARTRWSRRTPARTRWPHGRPASAPARPTSPGRSSPSRSSTTTPACSTSSRRSPPTAP